MKKLFDIFLLLLSLPLLSQEVDHRLDSFKLDSQKVSDYIKLPKKPNTMFQVSGQLQGEYQYGLVPFLMNQGVPGGFYRAMGDIQLQTVSLPWNVSYQYSSIAGVSGFQNYVRFSFDAPKYQEMLQKNKIILPSADSLLQEQLNLESKKESIMSKRYFYESLLDIQNLQDFKRSFSDTLPFQDSLSMPVMDTSMSLKLDTIGHYQELMSKKQTVEQKIKELDQGLTQIEGSIRELDQKYKKAQSFKGPQLPQRPSLFSFQKVKKMELGMCAPNLSPLLLNGVSLQGLHLEMQSNHFFSVTHGVTIVPIMFSIDPLQNQLKYTRNVFNFFDFNPFNQGYRITAVKGGYGKQESTHLHVGVLQGIGRMMIPGLGNEPVLGDVQKNYVLELDAKLSFSQQHTLECWYDKSYFHTNPVEQVNTMVGFQRIFSKERSHAAMAKHQIQIPWIKSKLVSSVRWIDPYFKNVGSGFLRSDNVRYEISSEHPLGSKGSLILKYKKEQDNLLQLFDYQNILTTYGAQCKYKIAKGLQWMGGYFPVIHEMKESVSSRWNKNFIGHSALTYSKINRTVTQVYSVSYNQVLLNSDSMNSSYKTLQANQELILWSNVRFFSNAQWLMSQMPELSVQNIFLVSAGHSFTCFKDMQWTTTLKYSYTQVSASSMFGYGVRLTKPIIKSLLLECQGDKLILGDFYNSMLNVSNIEKFPYLLSTKLVYQF